MKIYATNTWHKFEKKKSRKLSLLVGYAFEFSKFDPMIFRSWHNFANLNIFITVTGAPTSVITTQLPACSRDHCNPGDCYSVACVFSRSLQPWWLLLCCLAACSRDHCNPGDWHSVACVFSRTPQCRWLLLSCLRVLENTAMPVIATQLLAYSREHRNAGDCYSVACVFSRTML